MEHKKNFNQISVVCNHAPLAAGVVASLHPYSNSPISLLVDNRLLANADIVRLDNTCIIQEGLSLDIELTASQLLHSDLVIYIDHLGEYLKEEPIMTARLEALSNVVNCCIENNNGKFVFISSFTPMFGRHIDIVINERTIWESSMDLDLQSKYINLAEQEVFRGINEGLDCTILSCGFNINERSVSKPNIEKYFIDLLNLQRPTYQFIDYDDISPVLVKVVLEDNAPEKLLLINASKTRSEIETLSKYRPSMLEKISTWLRPIKHTNIQTKIDNSKTKEWYQHPFTDIHSFFKTENQTIHHL